MPNFQSNNSLSECRGDLSPRPDNELPNGSSVSSGSSGSSASSEPIGSSETRAPNGTNGSSSPNGSNGSSGSNGSNGSSAPKFINNHNQVTVPFNQQIKHNQANVPCSNECIGIVAGAGQFPELVAQMSRKQGLRVAICGFYGHTDPAIASMGHAFSMVHLGQLGKILAFFKKQKVRRICFAGAISKPKALSLRPDFRAVRMLLGLRGFGDDALLRAVAREVESEGMQLIQAASLVPGLRAPLGLLTRRKPSQNEWEDILYGLPLACKIGHMDIGQCIVVRRKMVVAVECLEGTDATLARGGSLGGAGCTAIKLLKPGQDERLDLPAIGLDTINTLLAAQYGCLVYQAGKTLFFDREKSIAAAEAGGLCVLGLPANDENFSWVSEENANSLDTFLENLQTTALKQAVSED